MFGVSAIRVLQNSEPKENMRTIMNGETTAKKNLRKVLSHHGLGVAEKNLAKVLDRVELPRKTLLK
jgi:G:T-mismatch repair DNA endonuclease (very short patch repair protein)